MGEQSSMTALAPALPRLYACVDQKRQGNYSDYESLLANCGCDEDYLITRKVSRGRFSEVFEGICVRTRKKCVMKCLKPIERKKIKREIGILQHLSGGFNIIKLLDVVYIPQSATPSLIFEHVNNVDFRLLYPTFTADDVQYYMLHALEALNYCHSYAVMHRDVKPDNVMIDRDQRKLRLIDFGLAEFYHPGNKYSIKVGTRYYKGPELLVGFQFYDYSLDVWSLGCMLAGMVFRHDYIFYGQDNTDQLVRIAWVLGIDGLFAYLDKYGVQMDQDLESLIGRRPRKPWVKFVKAVSEHLVSSDVIDLIDKMLLYDHAARISPKEALSHSFFE